MINAINSDNRILQGLLWAGVCLVLMPLKMSYIVGSYCSFFSMAGGLVPLTGAFVGVSGACAVFMMRLGVRALFSSCTILSVFSSFVPGFIASAAWIESYKFVRFFIPLVCMVAFLVHPVGGAAWAYTLFWLIPMALYVSNTDHVFVRALSSTLVAHAVGSVFWLYLHPSMTASMWLALIPVVIVERLLFASAMTSVYLFAQLLQPAAIRTLRALRTFVVRPA